MVQGMLDRLGAGREAAIAAFDWKTVPQGAATAVWAATIAPAGEIGAHYCEDCHVAQVNDDPNGRDGVRSYALDTEHAKALWTKSEAMVGEMVARGNSTLLH